MELNRIPESWKRRCSGDGQEHYIDSDGNRRYKDNNDTIGESPYRPCAKCGEFPNNDGDDFCIAGLGNVMNACCGHGNRKGYIQFDNGVTIRGYFEIENNNFELPPQTNLQMIRGLSVERLAEYLVQEQVKYEPDYDYGDFLYPNEKDVFFTTDGEYFEDYDTAIDHQVCWLNDFPNKIKEN